MSDSTLSLKRVTKSRPLKLTLTCFVCQLSNSKEEVSGLFDKIGAVKNSTFRRLARSRDVVCVLAWFVFKLLCNVVIKPLVVDSVKPPKEPLEGSKFTAGLFTLKSVTARTLWLDGSNCVSAALFEDSLKVVALFKNSEDVDKVVNEEGCVGTLRFAPSKLSELKSCVKGLVTDDNLDTVFWAFKASSALMLQLLAPRIFDNKAALVDVVS
jgi:hypothetical protein